MRPSRTVAGAVLTAALAVGALPGLVGSREPSPDRPLEAAVFRQVDFAATRDRSDAIAAVDAASLSAGVLEPTTSFFEPDTAPGAIATGRVAVALPRVSSAWEWKPPRYSLSGTASFYSNGTTAMRLPRGTVIVICGARGCLERVVSDYGPVASSGRIIDMYRPDFFAICGCGWWSGLTTVTVKVY
jgi:hypothetical protein